ncbi:MAG TPA: TerC/Alx family metal homeostasis membrane protein [Verrucomicrobiae bacterium]|jgi:tellurite resistance protein TerC|nr:TerC/Alx family metal homeostasis membrane protein [Verrucomicrobiae bacterium]
MLQFNLWAWFGFIFCILFFLALDLGVFHRRSRVVKLGEAIAWSAAWFVLAMLFAAAIFKWRSRTEGLQFTTGYVIELTLSLDNVVVMAVLFRYFRVPLEYQHRLLFWGILGVLILRGTLICAGVTIITYYDWILYVLGAFLVLAGIKMLVSKKQMNPEKNLVLRTARKIFSISENFDGRKFITRVNGRLFLTPLALALLLIETMDLIFALDSVPAVFSVTQDAFIIFTSNIFAILGLRSMYFVLANAVRYFRYLNIGLSAVLVFIGVKMLLDPHRHEPRWFQVALPTSVSLMVVAAILLISIALSMTAAHRDKAQ